MAEKEIIFKIGTEADTAALAKYQDLLEDVLGTYSDNIALLMQYNATMKANEAQIKKLTELEQNSGALSERQKTILASLISENRKLASAKSELQQVLKNEEKLMISGKGTYEQMNAVVNKLAMAYRKLSPELQAIYSDLPQTIDALRNGLKEADASIGNYQRNVGNYASAFNGLNMATQQVIRELPSLAIGFNTFFLAISNNLPILADEIKRVMAANAAAKAQGQATVPVMSQIVSGIFSWQTGLVMLVTALSMYGKDIANWISQLVQGKDALDGMNESMGKFGSSIASERAQLSAMFTALHKAKRGTAEYAAARKSILDKYGDLLENQRQEIRNLEDMEGAYKALANAVTAKAIMQSFEQQITEATTEFNKTTAKDLENIRDVFFSTLAPKGYAEAAIDGLFNEYIMAIQDGSENAQKRVAEIESMFEVRGIRYKGGKESSFGNRLTGGIEAGAGNMVAREVDNFKRAAAAYKEALNSIINAQQRYISVFSLTEDDITGGTDFEKHAQAVKEAAESWAQLLAAIGKDKAMGAIDTLKALADPTDITDMLNVLDMETAVKRADLQAELDERILSIKETGKAAGKSEEEISAALIAAREAFNEQIKALDAEYWESVAKIASTGDGSIKQINAPKEKKKKEGAPSLLGQLLGMTDEQWEEWESTINQALDSFSQLYSQIEQMAKESIQRRLDDELDALDRETESKKSALEKQREDGVISQKTYEKKLADIDKDAAAKQEALKREAFEKQKKWDIANALMNGALAITNILATVAGGPLGPAGIASLAISAAMTAANVALISTQKYARGGLLVGRSHAEGGIRGSIDGQAIELEGGEAVINKRATAKYYRELSAMNSENGWGKPFPGIAGVSSLAKRRFAEGGIMSISDVQRSAMLSPLPGNIGSAFSAAIDYSTKQTQAIVAALDRRIDRLQAFVALSDIESAENTKQLYVSRATL